jgi:diacylglycerol kinase (ATP)
MIEKNSKWVFIANPISGKGKALALAKRAIEFVGNTGAIAELQITEAKGDAERFAKDAVENGAIRVVACGGDGTIHEVVNGIMANSASERSVLGIVPAGRCNDFAYDLGIPKDSEKMIRNLLDGVPRPIDLGYVGDRYYTTVATLGFDSEVAQYVDEGHHPSFLKGNPAYLYAAFVKLLKYRSKWVSIKGDFGKFEGHIYLTATGNSTRYGGRMKVTPSALLDDGLLDVCFVRPITRMTFLRMLPKAFSGTHVNHPAVTMEVTKKLEIKSSETLWLWADGEQIAHTPTTIRVVHHAISMIAPCA